MREGAHLHSSAGEYPIFPASFLPIEWSSAPLSEIMWPYMWGFLSELWSVWPYLCQYHTVLMTIALNEVLTSGKCEFLKFVILSQNNFGYLGSLEVPYEFWDVFFYFCKNVIGIQIGIAWNLCIALGRVICLAITLSLQTHEQRLPTYLSPVQCLSFTVQVLRRPG